MDPCYSEVSQSQVAFIVEDKVLRFEIPVNNVIVMHVLKTKYDTRHKKLDYMFWKTLMLTNLVS